MTAGSALVVADAMDVAGAALARVTRSQLPGLMLAAVDHQVLAHAPARDAEPDARDVVVVESGALPRHPGEDPGVHAIVLVDELVAPVSRVRVDERLPELRARGEVACDVLELGRREDALVRDQAVERGQGGNEQRLRCSLT